MEVSYYGGTIVVARVAPMYGIHLAMRNVGIPDVIAGLFGESMDVDSPKYLNDRF